MAGKVSSDPNVFLLPDIGEGLTEAELIRWLVQPGQRVRATDALAEVETDKALTEVTSPRDGVIRELHGQEGTTVKVGAPFVSFEGDSGAASGKPPAGKASSASPPAKPQLQGAHDNGAAREDDGTVVGSMSASAAGVASADGKALATPAVRRVARDLGIDINLVPGTGIGGRVTKQDVEAFAQGDGASPVHAPSPARAAPAPTRAAPPPVPPAPATAFANATAFYAAEGAPSRVPAPNQSPALAPGADTARIPFRGVRRTIANRLRQSVDTRVHFTVMDEAEVSALDRMRRQLAAASGEKVSFLPFVCSAICRALAGEFGVLNATVEEGGEDSAVIVQHRAVHLGIATDTESGLMVPVIRDADRLGVLELGRHIAHIARSARDRSIPRDQLSGSTFTISNVGSYAGRFATPVINAPEVGILAAGRVHDGAVVKGGMIGVGKLLPLSLACDHRVVDGATAALCLARIVELLGRPEELLAPARS